MIEIDPIILMAMGEALLVLLITIIVMIVLAMKRKNNDKAAAEALVSKLKKERSARDEKVRCMLHGKYHYEDGDLDSSVRKFSKSERRFYQKFITTYLNRDHEKLSKLDREFDAATDPFFNIELPSSAEGSDDAEKENISRLQLENEKLKEELGVSMKTLGRMLGEYANILGEEKQEEKEKVVEESADEAPTTDEHIEIAEEEPSSSAAIEVADEVPSVDELLEVTQKTASADDLLDEQPEEESSNEPGENESLEITEEVSADSVDDLLESIGVAEEGKESTTDTTDDLPKEVLEDLERVANEIDEMAVEEPSKAEESEVDDIDALLAETATDAAGVEVVKTSEEAGDPDDILDELQKAQDLGQEIENLIEMEEDLEAPLIEDVDKKKIT